MRHALGLPTLDRGVGSYANPVIELVLGIELSAKTLIGIFLSDYDTVVVYIINRGEEVTLLVTVLEYY